MCVCVGFLRDHIYIYIYILSTINGYTIFKKVNFLLNQRYPDFIIYSGTLYDKNEYY